MSLAASMDTLPADELVIRATAPDDYVYALEHSRV